MRFKKILKLVLAIPVPVLELIANTGTNHTVLAFEICFVIAIVNHETFV